jgi:hypothetical protein
MKPESTKRVLLALAAPALLPFVFILGRRNEQDFLLGLSSSFWAGALIGVSIGCVVLAVALSARSWRRSKA